MCSKNAQLKAVGRPFRRCQLDGFASAKNCAQSLAPKMPTSQQCFDWLGHELDRWCKLWKIEIYSKMLMRVKLVAVAHTQIGRNLQNALMRVEHALQAQFVHPSRLELCSNIQRRLALQRFKIVHSVEHRNQWPDDKVASARMSTAQFQQSLNKISKANVTINLKNRWPAISWCQTADDLTSTIREEWIETPYQTVGPLVQQQVVALNHKEHNRKS